MALILNIETSTTNCSVSLAQEGHLLALCEKNESNYSHAKKLHPFIEWVFEKAKVPMSQLQGVAVSKGPGSYTGLRIGVSAAKGLCFALGIPLLSLSSLEILAAAANQKEGILISLLDARRMEVYAAAYQHDGELLKGIEAKVITPSSFTDFAQQGNVYLFGTGAEKCKGVVSHDLTILEHPTVPSAKEMVARSFDKYQKGITEDLAYFEPFYVKDFMAIPPKK